MLLNEVFKRDDGRKLKGEGGMGIKEQYAPLVTLFRNVVKRSNKPQIVEFYFQRCHNNKHSCQPSLNVWDTTGFPIAVSEGYPMALNSSMDLFSQTPNLLDHSPTITIPFVLAMVLLCTNRK